MTTHHFIVSHHEASWRYAYRGDITGPFTSRDKAVQAAIEEAESTKEPNVEVLVQDADMRVETVWRPNGTPLIR